MQQQKKKEVSVRVRFPAEVLVAAKRAAAKNLRSQNAEIVYCVASSLGLTEQPAPKQPG